MAKPQMVDSMVNMATALVICIHNTNMVVGRTRSNRRTHWMAKTTKAAIGKLNLGNQKNIKEMIYTGSDFNW